MAKISLENLLSELKGTKPAPTPQEAQTGSINKLRPSEDSVVDKTRAKLTLEEASRLGRDLSERFGEEEEAVAAQGAGLTAARVAELLSDD